MIRKLQDTLNPSPSSRARPPSIGTNRNIYPIHSLPTLATLIRFGHEAVFLCVEKGKFEILDEATRSEGSLLGPRGVVFEEELPICPKA
jgi:hypothetical protein